MICLIDGGIKQRLNKSIHKQHGDVASNKNISRVNVGITGSAGFKATTTKKRKKKQMVHLESKRRGKRDR